VRRYGDEQQANNPSPGNVTLPSANLGTSHGTGDEAAHKQLLLGAWVTLIRGRH